MTTKRLMGLVAAFIVFVLATTVSDARGVTWGFVAFPYGPLTFSQGYFAQDGFTDMEIHCISFTNNTDKTITAAELTFQQYDAFGDFKSQQTVERVGTFSPGVLISWYN